MNARASENYLAISRSSSASKSVEIVWAELGTTFFRAESSLLKLETLKHRAVVPLFELSFLTKYQKLTSA